MRGGVGFGPSQFLIRFDLDTPSGPNQLTTPIPPITPLKHTSPNPNPHPLHSNHPSQTSIPVAAAQTQTPTPPLQSPPLKHTRPTRHPSNHPSKHTPTPTPTSGRREEGERGGVGRGAERLQRLLAVLQRRLGRGRLRRRAL